MVTVENPVATTPPSPLPCSRTTPGIFPINAATKIIIYEVYDTFVRGFVQLFFFFGCFQDSKRNDCLLLSAAHTSYDRATSASLQLATTKNAQANVLPL